ncbi:helix-turn-helix domain-containing protein [Streptomyces sp. NBC_01320]|uniref:helix-turn-helix domain-containing protein n=1 Tax=Streptomyces sp. NBC_01320 TaxID=2903824 RepID=UPI002E0F6476|nr:helix-turn-helix domain-containing protein [Streptomyces sp. NBC_01320]
MADGAGGTSGTTGADGEPEPSDTLKAFGEVVKVFRKRARLTQEEFAPRVRYSVPTVASIEQGRRFPPPAFVERAEEVLEAFGVIKAAAKHLSRRRGLAKWFHHWAQLEADAATLYTYECRLIPGLLQTEAYARALFRDQLPPLGDEQIEARMTARAERQALLTERPNTAYSFILEEHLFRRHTGGVEVTRELIDHIEGLARRRNIELQIMPQVQEHHAGLHGPIRLLETPDHKWFAYSEGQESGHLHSDPAVVSTLQMRYARMRSQALSLKESTSLLERTRGAV